MKVKILFVAALLLGALSSCAAKNDRVILGDERFDQYLPLLEGKKVAILSNQTGDRKSVV